VAVAVKRIAPTNPDRITKLSTIATSTIPLPIVLATFTPKKNAAAKLKNAAQRTAWKGDKTLVETTVAIEFAASFIPL
jgi:hypothetical protein